ncbi:Esterase SGNH hydrolase-type [Penicillium nucicola]|uniref:Esterase SGNH hydrolase-type n=1 Tax=Penicillium nucicola TaxID=1850975 RepID=UPI0025455D72|nr:Esterase SGNH hydrolase-type [Penicillium nucicola]KAJ5747509.1 Esterase SGNH hydrolase-type [Penicillium nucicola]
MLHLATYALAAVSSIPLAQASPLSKPTSKFDWSSTKAVIAFGDSYTYVQGTQGRQNFSFIGDQFNLAYDTQTLLSNKIVQNQTGTAEGGPNWIEYLTDCGVKEGLTSPQSCKKQLWDFAFAGADISTKYTPLHHNYTVSLENQITQFTQYGHAALQKNKQTRNPATTLVAIWIGINDINDSAKYTVASFEEFYQTLMTTLFASVESLYELGYRKYLFMNLPPLDRTPGNQAKNNPSPNATQVAWYNEALEEQAGAFGSGHENVEVRVFDAHSRLAGMLDEPARYGIVNTTGFCAGYDQPDIGSEYMKYGCPVPLEEYFWFNTGHLTSHTHHVLAGELEEWLEKS